MRHFLPLGLSLFVLSFLLLSVCAPLDENGRVWAADENAGATATKKKPLPDGFVDVEDIDGTIHVDIRYATAKNFIGNRVPSYYSNRAILTKEAGLALGKVQRDLQRMNYSLLVFDAYRPQPAVDYFVEWSKKPGENTKQEYFPSFTKEELFKLGFVASKSGHSRGSSVDLTIFNEWTEQPLPMGSPFDFFDDRSTDRTTEISEEERKNRIFLREIMMKHGFVPYWKEWWHFRLKDEPFPETYFDFPVE
ncbi:MAG: M15 family metallopeptidase [Verrucomicrobiota bacterium]